MDHNQTGKSGSPFVRFYGCSYGPTRSTYQCPFKVTIEYHSICLISSFGDLRLLVTEIWLEMFQRSKNAAHQRLWEKISSNPGSLVTTYKDGMDLLNSGANWAFIGRTPAIDNSVIQSNGKLIKHPKVWRTVYGCLGLKKGKKASSYCERHMLLYHLT